MAYIEKGVAVVDRKLADDNLYLGVIGEFSSGKSTLINAFIEDHLLSTDVLQATTSSSTIIRHAEHLDVEAKFLDGTAKVFSREGITWFEDIKGRVEDTVCGIIPGLKSKRDIRQREQLRLFLNEATANEEVAKNISSVVLKHPSSILRNGIILVDTPGTNSNNERHTQVARETIHDICDVTMVVIPGNIPLSADLVKFLKITVGSAAHRCVFICNKCDLIRAKEQERMKKFLSDRICSEFGVNTPKIFMISALKALEQSGNTHSEDGYTTQLQEAREQIFSLMHQQRQIIQLEKTGNILASMVSPLKETLQERLGGYNKEHKALIDNMIEDVDAAWLQKATNMTKAFREKVTSSRRSVVSEVKSTLGDTKQKMFDRINAAGSVSALKDTIGDFNDLSLACQKSIEKIIQSAISSLAEEAKKETQSYAKEFETSYQRLATLGGIITMDGKEFAFSKSLSNPDFSINGTGNSTSIVNNANILENVAIGGGLAGGAVVGQMLIPIPVVGAIIGGIFGSLLGALFSPDLTEVKRKCRTEVSTQLSNCETKVLDAIDNAFDKLSTGCSMSMESIANKAFETYSALAKQMQERDNRRRKELEQLQEITNRDLALLHEHSIQVDNLLSKLKTR